MYLVSAPGIKIHYCTHYTLAKTIAADLSKRYLKEDPSLLNHLKIDFSDNCEFTYTHGMFVASTKLPGNILDLELIYLPIEEEDTINIKNCHNSSFITIRFERELFNSLQEATKYALTDAHRYNNKFHKLKTMRDIFCFSNKQMDIFNSELSELYKICL